MDDHRLIQLAAGGSDEAFETLYRRHERRVYKFCSRVAPSPEDAADATQEAFLRVFQRIEKLDGRDLNFCAYVSIVARNLCFKLIGKQRRYDSVGDIPEQPSAVASGRELGLLDDDPERAALLATFQDQVRSANSRLSARQRLALLLREVEELSYDEIAEIMGIKRNAVAQLLFRARLRLREELYQGAASSITATSRECERVAPLLFSREDGEALAGHEDRRVDQHVRGCSTCRLRVGILRETSASYRAALPAVLAASFGGRSIRHQGVRRPRGMGGLTRPSPISRPGALWARAVGELPAIGEGIATVATVAAVSVATSFGGPSAAPRDRAAVPAGRGTILSNTGAPGSTPPATSAPARRPAVVSVAIAGPIPASPPVRSRGGVTLAFAPVSSSLSLLDGRPARAVADDVGTAPAAPAPDGTSFALLNPVDAGAAPISPETAGELSFGPAAPLPEDNRAEEPGTTPAAADPTPANAGAGGATATPPPVDVLDTGDPVPSPEPGPPTASPSPPAAPSPDPTVVPSPPPVTITLGNPKAPNGTVVAP